jgi:hypothetical protein
MCRFAEFANSDELAPEDQVPSSKIKTCSGMDYQQGHLMAVQLSGCPRSGNGRKEGRCLGGTGR